MGRIDQRQRSMRNALIAVLLFTMLGVGGMVASQWLFNQQPPEAYTPLPTPTPEPTPEGAQALPLQVSLSTPADLTACNTGVMTFIPEGLDPYQLSPIVPVRQWFSRGNHVGTAFAAVQVANQTQETNVDLANAVVVRLVSYTPLPELQHAIYQECQPTEQMVLPTLHINPSEAQFTKEMGEIDQFTLIPYQSQEYALKVVADEPGLYQINLGVEYYEGDQVRYAWSPEAIWIRMPEKLERWSGELLVNRGECSFADGEYSCTQTVATDPDSIAAILALANTPEPKPTGQATSTAPAEECPSSPPTRLTVGETAEVSTRLSARLRVRAAPGTDERVVIAMRRGTLVKILDGPVCRSGYLWYQVELADGTTGWSAEGEQAIYYLEPRN